MNRIFNTLFITASLVGCVGQTEAHYLSRFFGRATVSTTKILPVVEKIAKQAAPSANSTSMAEKIITKIGETAPATARSSTVAPQRNWDGYKQLRKAIEDISFNHLETKELILKKDKGDRYIDIFGNAATPKIVGYLSVGIDADNVDTLRIYDHFKIDNEELYLQAVQRLLPGTFGLLKEVNAVNVSIIPKTSALAKEMGFEQCANEKYEWTISRKTFNEQQSGEQLRAFPTRSQTN